LASDEAEATLTLRNGRVELVFDGLQATGAIGSVEANRIHAALGNLVESTPFPRFGPDRETWKRNQELVRRLGAELADAMLGDPALRPLRQRLVEQPPALLWIQSDQPELLGLPWELLALDPTPDSPTLAERCEIIRVPIGDEDGAEAAPPPTPSEGSTLRVAIVSPRPAGPADVPLQPALGPVLATALSAPHTIQLKVIRPPTLAALRREIAGGEPFDVVHFDGHGREGATGTELVFEDANGDPDPVSADAFTGALAPAPPRLVLLNACRSASTGAGSEPAPSFAATLCLRLPSVRVIAMRYAVSVAFVEALVSTVYPLLAAGHTVGDAIVTTNARLARGWREGGPSTVPLFVNLTGWASSALRAAGVRAGAESNTAPVDWRQAAPALFWANEIELLHSALDRDRNLLVAEPLGGPASEVVEQFARYATASGAFERTVAGLGEPADAAAPDGTLHLVTLAPGEDREGMARACAELIETRPRSAAITLITDGRPLAGALPVSDGMVPPKLIGAKLQPLFAEAEPEQAWQLAIPCQEDLEAVRELADAGSLEHGLDLLERLRWGDDLSGLALAEPLRQALSSLGKEEAKLVSLLGLSGGGPIYQEMLEFVTTGASFVEALGRQVDAEEWNAALEAAAASGLFRLVEGLAPRLAVQLTAHQALALREHLVTWAGEEGLEILSRSFAEASIGFFTRFEEAFLRGGNGFYTSFLASGDPLLERAAAVGLRQRDDDLAAVALFQFMRRPTPDLGPMLRSMDALAATHAIEDLPEFRSTLLAWHARDTVDRELWHNGLAQAEEALAVAGAEWKEMPITYVQIMRSRALWRTARREEAEASLAEAARSAGPRQEGAVASACADFAQYLNLNPEETEQLRLRVGAPGEEESAPRRAARAEAAGEFGTAFALRLIHLREVQAEGSATAVAFGLMELGRLCAFYGEHDDAVFWLRRCLQAGRRLGLDPEQPLRYLGASAERAERFAEASSWLGDALSAARAKGDENAEAECLYELGLVAMQVDEEGTGAGREELEQARGIFERVGPPLHVGDCWMMLAQLEAHAGEARAARAALAQMKTWFDTGNAGADRREREQQLPGLLEELEE